MTTETDFLSHSFPPKDLGAPTWSLRDFDIGRKLGEGQFGCVYLARERRSGFLVALKGIIKSNILVSKSAHLLRREVDIHSRLLHPNVLQFYGWFNTPHKLWLILELCPSGELMDRILGGGIKDESKVSRCMKQMIQAIHACHEMNVLHRDIKPENILIDTEGNLKLADFGWAAHVPNLENNDSEKSPNSSGKDSSARYMKRRRKTYCGTLDYLSPELCRKEWYGKEVDIWCLGVLCYEIATGSPPFSAEQYLNNGVTEREARSKQQVDIQNSDIDEKLASRRDMSPNLKDFLRRTLAKDPKSRLSTQAMLQHPFITKHHTNNEP